LSVNLWEYSVTKPSVSEILGCALSPGSSGWASLSVLASTARVGPTTPKLIGPRWLRSIRPDARLRNDPAQQRLVRRRSTAEVCASSSGEVRATRHTPLDATEHGPPIAILHRLEGKPQIRQRMASDDSVLIGFDQLIAVRVQAMPEQLNQLVVECNEVFV